MVSSKSSKGKERAPIVSEVDYSKKKRPPKQTPVQGVQKIKSALRQTRRLLAKDKLAADVRVRTERRLATLEAELKVSEQATKERTMAVRYHKVKFFERQKVLRKITQTLRVINDPENGSKEKKKLQKQLLEHRIDLNYILSYPKAQKYISLFPSTQEDNQGPSTTNEDDKTSQKRQELRSQVRKAMLDGELSSEPEEQLKSEVVQGEKVTKPKLHSKTTDTKTSKTVPTPKGLKNDDFFDDAEEVSDGHDHIEEDDDDSSEPESSS